MALPVKMLTGIQASYDNLSEYNDGTLYFITDTFRIYKGAILYSDSGMSVIPNRQIQSPVNGKIYYSEADQKLYAYFEGEWQEASENNLIDDISVSSNRTWSSTKINSLPTIIKVQTRFDLPNVPNDRDKGSLFLAKDEHKMYAFLEETTSYIVFGTDYEQINVIDGGTA